MNACIAITVTADATIFDAPSSPSGDVIKVFDEDVTNYYRLQPSASTRFCCWSDLGDCQVAHPDIVAAVSLELVPRSELVQVVAFFMKAHPAVLALGGRNPQRASRPRPRCGRTHVRSRRPRVEAAILLNKRASDPTSAPAPSLPRQYVSILVPILSDCRARHDRSPINQTACAPPRAAA